MEILPDQVEGHGESPARIDGHSSRMSSPYVLDMGRKKRPMDDVAATGDSPGVKNDEPADEPVPKRQRQDSEIIPSAVVEHLYCNIARNKACADPIAGVVLPPNTPPLVMSKRQFSRPGEATDEEVQFIISRCNCAATEELEETWQTVLQKKEQRQDEHRWPSKWAYISHRRWQRLNEFVQMFCPWPGHGEFVDLTQFE